MIIIMKKDPLENYQVYIRASAFFENVFDDTKKMMSDIRGKELTRQLIRSAGSICANFEEGYGSDSTKHFRHYLTISRGSARETKGWYKRSKFFFDKALIDKRINEIDKIISLLVSMIETLKKNDR
jgi:four helix bundle protein